MESIIVVGFNVAAVIVAAAAIASRGWDRLNSYMLLLITFAALWTSILELQKIDPELSLFAVRSAFGFAIIMGFFIWKFSDYLVNGKNLKQTAIYGTLTAIGFLLSYSSLITESVVNHPTIRGSVIPERGPLYPVFIILLLTMIIIALVKLYRAAVRARGLRKAQLKTIFLGLTSGVIVGIITNVILPNITGNTRYGRLGFIGVAIWAFGLTYAIVQHKFLNINRIIAKAATYVLTLSVFTVTYISLYFLIISNVDFDNRTFQVLFSLSFAIFTGASYRPLVNIFNELSDRVFYRDAYEPQQLIDRLNATLVESSDLNDLLGESSKIIKQTFKSKQVFFYINQTSYKKGRQFGAETQRKDQELENIIEMLEKQTPKTYMVTKPSFDDSEKKIDKLLRKEGVELAIKLTDNKKHGSGVGYMFIGERLSGSLYGEQDVRILETIANELVIAIENIQRFEEIKEFNVTLQEEVDDATKRLRSTNAKLRALDDTKDEFISMASHQLRTPLTSIKGYLSMVLEGDAGKLNEQQKKMLSQAFVSSQRMNYLISDLLNVSRLKTGKFEIDNKPTDLANVIQSELDQLYDTANVRGLKLVFDPPKDFPIINIDENKVRQVIMNFIDNAIYYTEPGGSITIQLAHNDHSVELKVIDTGLGVPKKEQHNLFSKFYRAENARKARPDGTGLGLFMAKKVVIAQGGAIIFKSQEGKGSTFGFSFPLSKVGLKKG